VPSSSRGHVASSGALDAGSVRPVVSYSAPGGPVFGPAKEPTTLFI